MEVPGEILSGMGLFMIVFDLKKQLGSGLLRVVVDAYFSKVTFLKPLVDEGIQVITRMRSRCSCLG